MLWCDDAVVLNTKAATTRKMVRRVIESLLRFASDYTLRTSLAESNLSAGDSSQGAVFFAYFATRCVESHARPGTNRRLRRGEAHHRRWRRAHRRFSLHRRQ